MSITLYFGSLAARQRQLEAETRSPAPKLPRASQLRTIGEHIKVAINGGRSDVVKRPLRELIDRVGIGPEKQAQPFSGFQTNSGPGHHWPGPAGPRFV
jgi:hypothetical protein